MTLGRAVWWALIGIFLRLGTSVDGSSLRAFLFFIGWIGLGYWLEWDRMKRLERIENKINDLNLKDILRAEEE